MGEIYPCSSTKNFTATPIVAPVPDSHGAFGLNRVEFARHVGPKFGSRLPTFSFPNLA